MKYLIIDIYGEFQCVGTDCSDTCCAGWSVDVDPRAAQTYKETPGEFGQKLRDHLHEENGRTVFKMPDGHCAFLTKDKLCGVYQELGPENMCFICRTYPRLLKQTGDIIFSTLTFACPEVVRLMMEHKGVVEFDLVEDDKTETIDESTDWSLFNTIVNGLTISVGLLQNREIPFAIRMRLLLLFQTELQNCITQGTEIDALKLLFSTPENYLPLAKTLEGNTRNDMEKVHSFVQFMNIAEGMDFLEIFYHPVNRMVQDFLEGSGNYDDTALFEQISTSDYEIWYENYCVYYLIGHYMEALKTKKTLAKVQELVWMLNTQQCIMMADLAYNHGELVRERHIRMVSRLARMFEHNADNFSKVRERLISTHSSDTAYWLSMV